MNKWWREFFEGFIMVSLGFILITVWGCAVVTFVYWGIVPIDWVYFRVWCVFALTATILLSIRYANIYSK